MNRSAILCLLKVTVIIAFLFLYTGVSAQKQETDAYFTALRTNQSASALSIPNKKEEQYIKPLSAYLHDTVPALRVEAYYQLSKLGLRAKQKSLRKKVVNLLITGWRDEEPGIHGVADNALMQFQKEDFDRTAIDSIKSRLNKLPVSPGKLFKLIGFLDLRELAPKIKSYVEEQQPPLRGLDRWAGYIALARLGDQHAVDFILNRVRKLGMSDDMVYEVLPDLVYARTYRTIHYLEEALYSNETNCSAPSAESQEKMTCAYRIMELLAPVIKDYPFAVGPGGDLETENYPAALEKTRAWFKQKNGNYEIIRDTF